MARGRGNQNSPGSARGGGRGFQGADGRGGRGGRGRGRGGGGGRGRGRGGSAPYEDALDFLVIWNDPYTPPSVSMPPRGRGRGRGGRGNDRGHPSFPGQGNTLTGSPRGAYTPRGGSARGRGRGFDPSSSEGRAHEVAFVRRLGNKLGAGAPLSKVLYEDRPFLRPVIFVRGLHQPTLFQEQEELLEALIEEVADDEASHVPTAERVARLFTGAVTNTIEADDGVNSNGEAEGDELEEIDFEDLGRIQAEVDAAAAAGVFPDANNISITEVEEQFTGFYIDTKPGGVEASSVQKESLDIEMAIGSAMSDERRQINATTGTNTTITSKIETDSLPASDETPLFFIDTTPAPVSGIAYPIPPPMSRIQSSTTVPGIPEADDEEIVYVAPHPRHGRSVAPSPAIRTTELPVFQSLSTSLLTGTSTTLMSSVMEEPFVPTEVSAEARVIPPAPAFGSIAFSTITSATPPRRLPQRRVGQKPKSMLASRVRRQAQGRKGRPIFGGMGTAALQREESRLRDQDDPKRDQRRRGDSDLEWGDEDDEDEEEVDMEVDMDADVSLDAMKSFVRSMGQNGSRHVTMEDLEIEQRIRLEDAEGEQINGGSDESEDGEAEFDAEFDMEERQLVGEGMDVGLDDSEDDDDDSDDDEEDVSPGRNFQARLDRIRKQAEVRTSKGKGKGKGKARDDDSDNDLDDLDDLLLSGDGLGTEEDEYLSTIQMYLEENSHILGGRSKKANTFRAIHDGDADMFEVMQGPAHRKKDKGQDLPPELSEQWMKDRVKKAERKAERELQRLMDAADPLSFKKGGKKGKKAMRRAARLDASDGLPHQIYNMASLETEIRRFLMNLEGPNTMVLPPMTKDERRKVHEFADAFKLKSVSKGKGVDRYTTLVKTTRSGLIVNEKKVARLLRTTEVYIAGGKKGPPIGPPKHREGEEVGKAAPKISGSNIGFKMLEGMGWADGQRIGATGGLENPLMAIIKHTKLGLGATRS